MESQGQVLGFDLNDSVYIAVANGMQMYNFDEVVEIDVAYDSAQVVDRVVGEIRQFLTNRHRETEDFIVTNLPSHIEGVR